jgi:predicted AAA+ superfamily ATPase
MQIQRDRYLKRLIEDKGNGLIKIVTGIRLCGKTYLLFELFKQHLLADNVEPDHIIEIALDDRKYKNLRNPDACYKYVAGKIDDQSGNPYYILLDEVQMMDEFEDVLNGFLHMKNVDVYVTGSNSKFLSSDIITEFRGRSDEIRMYPLSFSEFVTADQGKNDSWEQYLTFGGLPQILKFPTYERKAEYLKALFKEVYLKDIIERNGIRNDMELETLVHIVASAVGSLTNPQKLSDTFKSTGKIDISIPTISQYLTYLEEAFLVSSARRYDVKGKKYISTPKKYYFEDVGLRNAMLNFRQAEETHLMENIIYNELRYRGYLVDVGVVNLRKKDKDGSYARKQVEIDFVANRGNQKYYIQSALSIPTDEKKEQEERPLISINDSFKKIIVVKDDILLRRDEHGIVTMGVKEFLTDQNSLEK